MGKREVIYLGWQGFDNFGDDLLYETWRAALGRDLSNCAPLGHAYVRAAPRILAERVRRARADKLVLLGGGTTVGFENWGRHARRAVAAFGAQGIIVAGAGIAAAGDKRAIAAQPQSWSDWHALEEMILFGVRGPISAQEAREHWRPARVLGDPALLYPLVAPVPVVAGKSVGVSIGAGGRTEFDIEAVARAVDRTSASLSADRITIFQLAEEDAELCVALQRRLRGQSVIAPFRNVRETMVDIARTQIMFSERLHGAVAAASLGVPVVPLTYGSKCTDFMLSIDEEHMPLPTTASADDITFAARAQLNLRARTRIDARVAQLQEDLIACATAIGAWLEGTSTLAQLRTHAEAGN